MTDPIKVATREGLIRLTLAGSTVILEKRDAVRLVDKLCRSIGMKSPSEIRKRVAGLLAGTEEELEGYPDTEMNVSESYDYEADEASRSAFAEVLAFIGDEP